MHLLTEKITREELQAMAQRIFGNLVKAVVDVRNNHPNFVEFDSMINVRPMESNRSRSVEDPAIQARILDIVRG
jgi:hypothetical protein